MVFVVTRFSFICLHLLFGLVRLVISFTLDEPSSNSFCSSFYLKEQARLELKQQNLDSIWLVNSSTSVHQTLFGTMPEEITTESLMHNIMETVSDTLSKHKDESFPEEKSHTWKPRKLFGREKPVHHILGGGKSADVLLWRNKKISAGVLGGAAIIWILFEWLNYHFLTLLSFVIVLGMLVQFAWKNASGMLNRSSSVPRLVIPEEVFVNIGELVGSEMNRGLGYLQDVACEGTLKQFVIVACSLWAAAIISSWCDFLTLIFVGFVAAHTLPVLYERYEDQIDDFAYSILEQLQHNYRKLDTGVLSRIPKTRFRGKKVE